MFLTETAPEIEDADLANQAGGGGLPREILVPPIYGVNMQLSAHAISCTGMGRRRDMPPLRGWSVGQKAW